MHGKVSREILCCTWSLTFSTVQRMYIAYPSLPTMLLMLKT